MVIRLLGGSFNIEDILLAQVDVFIQKERSQVALQVSAVLHHDGTGHRVTPTDRDATPTSVLTGLGGPMSRTLNAAVNREAHVGRYLTFLSACLKINPSSLICVKHLNDATSMLLKCLLSKDLWLGNSENRGAPLPPGTVATVESSLWREKGRFSL